MEIFIIIFLISAVFSYIGSRKNEYFKLICKGLVFLFIIYLLILVLDNIVYFIRFFDFSGLAVSKENITGIPKKNRFYTGNEEMSIKLILRENSIKFLIYLFFISFLNLISEKNLKIYIKMIILFISIITVLIYSLSTFISLISILW